MNKDKRGADLNALLKDVRFPTPMPTPEPGASAIRQAWLAIQGFHASHALPEFCCSYTAFEEFVGRLLKGSVNHPEDMRILFEADAYCPSCGHNRDKSSVSSIDNEDGTNSCQMCGIDWKQLPQVGNDG